jgi:hypothetical protein
LQIEQLFLRRIVFFALFALLAVLPSLSFAADVDGSKLSAAWGIPFAGVLLSIALMPLLAADFWHHHYGKVTAAWALAFIVPFAIIYGCRRCKYRLCSRLAG